MEKLGKLLAIVRRAFLWRTVLRTSAITATVLGALALLVAMAFPALPRWPGLALLALGPLLGLLHALRRMPSEAELVVYVDMKLEAEQAILTAWERRAAEADPFDELARARAAEALAGVPAKRVRPRVLSPDLWGLPFAAGTFAAALVVPVPPPPIAPPGVETVQLETEALRRIERLEDLARDEEEEERLRELAREARELRQRLGEGMEQR